MLCTSVFEYVNLMNTPRTHLHLHNSWLIGFSGLVEAAQLNNGYEKMSVVRHFIIMRL